MQIAPTWEGVAPLLIQTIAREGDAPDLPAPAEVLRMARALDEWNRRAQALAELLHEARECVRDEEFVIAEANLLRALAALEGA